MNPPYRILLCLAKSCTLVQFDNKNAFHRAVLNFMGLKLKLRGVSTSCIVVMVTYYTMKVAAICLTMIGYLLDTNITNISW